MEKLYLNLCWLLFGLLTISTSVSAQLSSLPGSGVNQGLKSTRTTVPTVTAMVRVDDPNGNTLNRGGDIQVFTLGFDDLGGEYYIGDFYDPVGVQFGGNWFTVVQQQAGGTGNFCNNPSGTIVAGWEGSNDAIINFDFDGLGIVNRIDVWYASDSGHPDSPNPQESGFIIYDNLGGLGNPIGQVNFSNEIQGGPDGCFYSAWFADGISFLGAVFSIRFFGQAERVAIDDLTFYGQANVQLEVTQNPITVPEGSVTELSARLGAVPANGTVKVDVEHFSGDNDIYVNGGSTAFVFTESNWNVPQSITISASEDNDQSNGNAVFLVERAGGTGSNPSGGTSGSVILPVEVIANEADDDVTLMIAASPDGLPTNATIPPIGSQTSLDLSSDLPFQITANPPAGFLFSEFQASPNGVVITAPVSTGTGGFRTTLTDVPLGVNPTVTAVFVVDTDVSLTVFSSPTGGGTIGVGSNPPVGSGVFQIPVNTNVSLQAIPADGMQFDNWQVISGDSGSITDPNDPTTTVNAGQDTTIGANFSDGPQGVLSWVISPGSIDVEEGRVGTVQVRLSEAPDASVTFSVNPDATSSSDLDVDGSRTFTIPGGSSASVSVPIIAFEDDFDTEDGQAFFEVEKVSGPHTISNSGFNATAVDDDITLDLSPETAADGNTQPSSPIILDTAGPNSDLPFTIRAIPNLGRIFFGWTIQQGAENLDLSPPDIDTNGTATSEIRAASGDIVMVAIFAPDELQFMATPNPIEIVEGGQQTMRITLTKPPQPAGEGRTVVAKITSGAGDADLTVVNESQTFTFTDSNWNDPSAWVKTFRAAEDNDTTNGQRQFLVELVGGTSVDLIPDLLVNAFEVDNDFEAGSIVVTPAALNLEAEEMASFLVRLSGPPTGIVEIKPRKSPDPMGLVQVSGSHENASPMVFNPSNYHIPQEVSVFVPVFANDELDPGEVFTVDCTFEQVGGDGGNYTSVVRPVHATRSDGNAELDLTPRLVNLQVGEEGDTKVRLTDPPASAQLVVRIEYEGEGDVSLGLSSTSFTAGNYDVYRVVDIIANEPATGRIRFSWQSGSPQVTTQYVDVVVTSNQPQLVANPSAVEFQAGQEGSFTLALTAEPETNMVVSLAAQGGDLGVVSPSSGQITFTPQNYFQPQTVTLSGSGGSGSVQIDRVSGSPAIDSLNVPVTVIPSEPAFVLTPASLQMSVGEQDEFTVRLATEPFGLVSVALTPSGAGGLTIVEPSGHLQFTPENYQTGQVVRVEAAQVGSGNVAVTQVSGSPAIPAANLAVTVGGAGDLDVLVTPESLEFDPNQTRTLRVKLSGVPESDVILSLAASNTSGNTGIRISSPASGQLTFTTENATTEQTVSVTATGTGTAQVALNHLLGPQVNGVIVPVVVDAPNCTGTLSLTPFSTELTEGSPGVIQVSQTNFFQLPRTFEITSTYPDAVNFSVPESITIESGQTISLPVAALEDENVEDAAARFVISLVDPSSPPCSISSKSFDLYAADDDYELSLHITGDDGSSATFPASGTVVSVDTTTYDTGYPIYALAGPGYQFSHWSGDVGFLIGSSNPAENPTPLVIVEGPDPAIAQIVLTAHFEPIEPEVLEEVDAMVDALLDQLIAQCGLGAADFSERNLASGNRTGAMDGGRILPHSGQELRDEVDLSLPGLDHPTQINLTRRHMTRRNATRSPFGPAWFFNYRIYFTRDEDGHILLHNLGRTDVFTLDPVETGVWNGTGGRFGRMVHETSVRVVLRAPSGLTWQFRSIHDPSDPRFNGILEKITSPNGNHIQFQYQNDGNALLDRKMIKIVDAFGRDVALIYGEDGNAPYVSEVRDATDPDAIRVWHYGYDGAGRLTSVRSPAVVNTNGLNNFPQGKRTVYQYRDHSDPRLKNALTAIVAPNQTHAGQSYARYRWTYYDEDTSHPLFGYVKSHTLGNPDAPYPLAAGGTFNYNYQPMASGGGIGEVSMCTTVTDRAGAKTVLDYNRRGLLLEERIENPEAGTNKTVTPLFKRAYTYNARGDMASSKNPIQIGQEEPAEYREDHPDLATTPNHMLRQERRKVRNVDLRGGDQVEIVEEIRYEPVFNKIFAAVDPRGFGENPEFEPAEVTTYQYFDYMEDLSGAILHFAPQLGMTASQLTFEMIQAGIPDRIQDQWGIDPLAGGRVDINGDGRTELDPCGNLIRRDYPDATLPVEAEDLGLDLNQVAYERFVYNRFGQLIQRIDAEDNVTRRYYFPFTDPSGWNGSTPQSTYDSGGGFIGKVIQNEGPADPTSNSGSGAPAVQSTLEYAYRVEGNFPRNARGVATLVTDGRGVVTRHLVNELDQMVIQQAAWQVPGGDPDLAVLSYGRRYFYDANNNLQRTGIHNVGSFNGGPNFFYHRNVFDILDQPVRKIADSGGNGLNITTEIEYDGNQNMVKKTDGVGTPEESVTLWEYDARDLMVSFTKGATGNPDIGEVATFTYGYDDNGNRVREIDADGDVTHFEYDGFDRMVKTTDRVGNYRKITFNAASQNTSVEVHGPAEDSGPTMMLSKRETLFDQRNRPYEQLNHLFHYPGRAYGKVDPGANGTFLSFEYGLVRTETIFDRSNRPIGEIDADGDLFVTQYNGMGGIFRTIDPLGNTVVNEYDVNHNLIAKTETEVDPQGVLDEEVFVTRYRYDALNRVFMTQEPNGQLSQTFYDSRNNVTRTKDALNNFTYFYYDALNRAIEEIRYLSESGHGAHPNDSDGAIHLKTEWDALSRVKARIDDLGNRTEYEYDDLNRTVSRIQPGGATETWTYNGDGEMISSVNPAGAIAQWQYDAAGRLVQMAVDSGSLNSDFSFSGTVQKRWQYDGLNRQIMSYDDNGASLDPSRRSEVGCFYFYDSLDQPVLEIQTVGQEELREPLSLGKKVMQEWQGRGRLVSQTYPNGRLIRRAYDTLDRLSNIREESGDLIARFEYMGPRRDLRITYGNRTQLDKKDPLAPTTLGYGYDQNRRPIHHRWERQTDGSLVTNFSNTYNGAGGFGTNRIAAQYREHFGRGDQWSFDSRYRIHTFSRNDDPDLISQRELDGTDAMTEFVDEGFHQTPIPDWRWIDYFYFGGLPRPHDENGNLRNDTQLDFTYDYNNRLSVVREYGSDTVLAEYLYTADNKRVVKRESRKSTRYLYQGWQVLEERDGHNFTLRQFVEGRSLDEHLQMLDVAGSGTAYYYHGNSQGFVGALTDDTGGVVEYTEYSMLGRPTLIEGDTQKPAPGIISTVGNPYGFHGRRHDPETGFYYFRNRYYDPNTGHFVTVDPKGRWQHGQGNGFSAFSGDPWNRMDPMGLDDTIFDNTLSLLLAGFQGMVEAQERFYNWIGLGLQGETIGPPTVGYTHQQTSDLERIQAENEQAMAWRNFLEMPGYLFGGSGSSLGSMGTRARACLGRFQAWRNLGGNGRSLDYQRVLDNLAANRAGIDASNFRNWAFVHDPSQMSNLPSVLYQVELPSDLYPNIRAAYHFREANSQLLRAMDSDPDFAAGIESFVPGIRDQLINPRSISTSAPRAWTWHHAEETGEMWLVTSQQHWNPGFWSMLHPGNRGGMSRWGGGYQR